MPLPNRLSSGETQVEEMDRQSAEDGDKRLDAATPPLPSPVPPATVLAPATSSAALPKAAFQVEDATDVETSKAVPACDPARRPPDIVPVEPFMPSQSHQDGVDPLDAQLAAMEAPFFLPYWSAAFFVTALGAILMIWSFCWMYLGAFWNPLTRLHNLHVMLLDCDMVPPDAAVNASFAPYLHALVPAPVATSLLNATVWNASSPLGHVLGWKAGQCGAGGPRGCGTAAEEAACVAALSNDVLQGDTWALLYFPSNFTTNYLSWFPTAGISPLYQRPVARYIYARGRDYSTYTYMSGVIPTGLLPSISRAFTLGLAANPQVMQLLSPVFLATGLSLQETDLAPVKNFGQHFATYIFCVLLWLGSSFVVVSSYQFKLPTETVVLDPRTPRTPCSPKGGEVAAASSSPDDRSVRAVRLRHLVWAIMVKALVSGVYMFALVVLLCVVLWGLGDGNEQWHLNPGYAMAFGWYMSWSFVSINAVLLHVIGIERFSSMTALLLILQLTSCSGILTLDLSNRFFYIGKGLPFYYGVRGFRTIFFGTQGDKMYINWLVFTAYNLVFAPLGVMLVALRVWTATARDQERARKHHRAGNAVGVGGIVLPVAVGFG